MYNVTELNRYLTDTVSHMSSIEGHNTRQLLLTTDSRVHVHVLVDQVTLASLTLLRYTDRKYTVPIVSVYYTILYMVL